MANWNLSVSLRGEGRDLAQALKNSARHARTLGANAATAKKEVKELGEAAKTAARHIRTLGTAARNSARDLSTLANAARDADRYLTRYGSAARTANQHLRSLGDSSRTASRQLARMHGDVDRAVRDLIRLAQAAQRATTQTNRVGNTQALRRLERDARGARGELRALATLMSGGALTMGAAEFLANGNEYQQAMNTFGAVTNATAGQMQRAAATAMQLGADLRLPNATAASAAEAMVELAKAGFRTDQAISATRASLELASAAQVNAADSAKYLGDIMDQFGLGADQASRAADTLAATANSASGDIIDIYYSMKYAGPVASTLGVTLEETAAAIGMLGKAGILGQTAGTTLRGMFANLAAPTPKMIAGLKDMGIEAWDAQGRFKGLRYVIEGLSKAQHDMTQQDFVGAIRHAMGKPAMSGAAALAHQGVDSFDALMVAVQDTGAAADIAAAKGEGLAGAMTQLKTQARQTGITIYDGLAPGLERLVRGVTAGLSAATPKIEAFFDYLNDAAALFGPDVERAARAQFATLGDAASALLAPFEDLGQDVLVSFLHLLIRTVQTGVEVLSNFAEGAEPIVEALSGIADGSSGAATALDIVVLSLNTALDVVGWLSGLLGPLGGLVAGLVGAFGDLPGPIQTAVLALLLFRRFGTGPVTALQSRVTATAGAFRRLGEEMAVQRTLAAASGTTLSRYGTALAVLQTRVGVIGDMGAAFRTASSEGTGLTGTLRGITAAAGTGLSRAFSGLTAAMGGPWGLAIAGATVALGLLASSQEKAAQKAAEHKAYIDSLTEAIRASNDITSENVRAVAAKMLQDRKLGLSGETLTGVMKRAGYSLEDITSSYLGQGESINTLVRRLRALAREEASTNLGENFHAGMAYDEAADALEGMAGEAGKAAARAKELDDAAKGSERGVTAYTRLKDAVTALGDKTADADTRTRALRDALDLLSGGSVSYEAAQARVNKAITAANDAISEGVEKADGWGKALIKANGGVDTTTKNGQQLYDSLYSIADAGSAAAVAAYDLAQQQGKSLPESLAAARAEIKNSRDAAIDLAGKYNVGGKAAKGLADSVGLIPSQVSILLQAQGLDSTLADLLAVQATFESMPDAETVRVDVLSEEARRQLEDLGYQIELIPGTREYEITAPTADARTQLDLLIAKLASVNGTTVPVNADTQKAIADLQAVQNEVRNTKGRTITMRAPTAEARRQLEALGFKIKTTKGKNVEITVPTGGPTSAVAAIQGAINRLEGKTVTVRTNYVETRTLIARGPNGQPLMTPSAHGNVFDYFADGGVTRQRGGARSFAGGAEHHIAQIAPAGTWRVWAEPETGGEAYIPLAPAKRARSRAIAEETVRRLGGKGIAWNADGSVLSFAGGGFTYQAPGGGRAASDVQSRYDERHQPISREDYNKKIRARANALDRLREAEAKLRALRRRKHTGAQEASAERKVAAARRAYATATEAANSATARYKKRFSLADWQKELAAGVRANTTWEANLVKVGRRAGYEVEQILRDMGMEGASMVSALAGASSKQFNAIVANLKKLAPTASAVLADYTRQLTAHTKTSAAFQSHLVRLAGMGYGDLATQLAAQGDEAAQKIAAGAVASKTAAAAANKAAQANARLLSGEELEQLVQIIAAIKTSTTGLHAVADTTGLGEDEIIAVANKATGQIRSSLGARSARFLADLAKANRGQAYANGGIREGIYATRGGLIRFAEPSTGGEAYIPLGAGKRAAATRVLSDVAGRFGLGLTPAGGGTRVVVIREGGPLIGSLTVPVTKTSATAADIAAQVGRQVRRARRGGVAARAGY